MKRLIATALLLIVSISVISSSTPVKKDERQKFMNEITTLNNSLDSLMMLK